MFKFIKKIIQIFAHNFGYHILSKGQIAGDMNLYLAGVKKRGFNPKVILDLGAHKAVWSYEAAKYFNSATFYLLEPQEELVSYLNHFFENHKGKYILAGVGSKNDTLKLSIWDDLAGSSFLNSHEINSGKPTRSLPVYSIDHLIESGQIEVPNLCKIDIQGFELEALKGAKSILGKTEMFIIESSTFEFTPDQPILHEIIHFMAQNGYVIYDIAGFLNRPFDNALGQIDLCFVLKNSALRAKKNW